MMKMKWRSCLSALILFCASLSGCKSSDDALALSEQMTATAASLKAYYGALAGGESETISLFELDQSLAGVDFPADQRKDVEETRAALLLRQQMAVGLGQLAESFRLLAGSKAPDEVATAATALGNELVQVKALPSGSPVPESLGRAGKLLLEIVRKREEQKAAQAMDQTVTAIRDLFFLEKPVYDHMTDFRFREAKVLARHLISYDQIDSTALLAPALEPFHLTPLPGSAATEASLKALALTRLDAGSEEAQRKARAASAAMLASLTEMSSRVHTLATEHRMGARGNPFTLQDVEFWLTQLS